ncbi:MAG: hypothetical protein M3164_06540 [Actinomycetota bacterium]|nr:hypothetical protein [Actinomycetota bacterium]
MPARRTPAAEGHTVEQAEVGPGAGGPLEPAGAQGRSQPGAPSVLGAGWVGLAQLTCLPREEAAPEVLETD